MVYNNYNHRFIMLFIYVKDPNAQKLRIIFSSYDKKTKSDFAEIYFIFLVILKSIVNIAQHFNKL